MHKRSTAKKRRPLWLGLVAAGMLFFAAGATAQTPTERILNCVQESMDSFATCLGDSGGFWGDVACTIIYDADFYLCFLEVIPT